MPERLSHCPSMMCRSVRHTPAPPTRTITSSGPVMVGSGTSFDDGVLVVAVQADSLHDSSSATLPAVA